jgi:hypothetical protein
MKVKVVVSLVILAATLLLVSNMAFASCAHQYYYDVYMAQQPFAGVPSDEGYVACWSLCIQDNGTGQVCDGDGCGTLYQFGQRPAMSGDLNNDGESLLSSRNGWKSFIAIWDKPVEAFYLQLDHRMFHLTGLGVDDEGKVVINGYLGCNIEAGS